MYHVLREMQDKNMIHAQQPTTRVCKGTAALNTRDGTLQTGATRLIIHACKHVIIMCTQKKSSCAKINTYICMCTLLRTYIPLMGFVTQEHTERRGWSRLSITRTFVNISGAVNHRNKIFLQPIKCIPKYRVLLTAVNLRNIQSHRLLLLVLCNLHIYFHSLSLEQDKKIQHKNIHTMPINNYFLLRVPICIYYIQQQLRGLGVKVSPQPKRNGRVILRVGTTSYINTPAPRPTTQKRKLQQLVLTNVQFKYITYHHTNTSHRRLRQQRESYPTISIQVKHQHTQIRFTIHM